MYARFIILSLLVTVMANSGTQAQNSTDDAPRALQPGARLFRANCARCHDLNGQGYKAPDLTLLSRGMTNAQLARIIATGIPGTEMPAIKLEASEVDQLLVYLGSLGGPLQVDRGDASKGEALFWGKAQCGKCHMVAGRGGRLGPELTQIGVMRSRVFVIREIRSPSDYIGKGYDPVTVVTMSGERIVGIRKNEDLFSLQMMDERENLRLFLKEELKDVLPMDKSLMPVYAAGDLSDTELDDILRYLSSLR